MSHFSCGRCPSSGTHGGPIREHAILGGIPLSRFPPIPTFCAGRRDEGGLGQLRGQWRCEPADYGPRLPAEPGAREERGARSARAAHLDHGRGRQQGADQHQPVRGNGPLARRGRLHRRIEQRRQPHRNDLLLDRVPGGRLAYGGRQLHRKRRFRANHLDRVRPAVRDRPGRWQRTLDPSVRGADRRRIARLRQWRRADEPHPPVRPHRLSRRNRSHRQSQQRPVSLGRLGRRAEPDRLRRLHRQRGRQPEHLGGPPSLRDDHGAQDDRISDALSPGVRRRRPNASLQRRLRVHQRDPGIPARWVPDRHERPRERERLAIFLVRRARRVGTRSQPHARLFRHHRERRGHGQFHHQDLQSGSGSRAQRLGEGLARLGLCVPERHAEPGNVRLGHRHLAGGGRRLRRHCDVAGGRTHRPRQRRAHAGERCDGDLHG